MSSNLPPGVTPSDIDGPPAAQMMDRWLDSDIGDWLLTLAHLAVPDIRGYRCKVCRRELIEPDAPSTEWHSTREGNGSLWCGILTDIDAATLAELPPLSKHTPEVDHWPPWDIEKDIIDKLRGIKEELDRA